MRIALYGGTFDPIHNGHIHVIEQLISRNLTDLVMVIPAGQPLLRTEAPIATSEQRRTMCQLAIDALAPELKVKVQINPIEILRQGPSYAIDTVEAVNQSFPEDELFFIIGTDAFAKIDQWHRIEDLKKLIQFIVIDRPDFPGKPTVDIQAIAVSATQIRNRTSELVPAPVATYIKEQNLYGRN